MLSQRTSLDSHRKEKQHVMRLAVEIVSIRVMWEKLNLSNPVTQPGAHSRCLAEQTLSTSCEFCYISSHLHLAKMDLTVDLEHSSSAPASGNQECFLWGMVEDEKWRCRGLPPKPPCVELGTRGTSWRGGHCKGQMAQFSLSCLCSSRILLCIKTVGSQFQLQGMEPGAPLNTPL